MAAQKIREKKRTKSILPLTVRSSLQVGQTIRRLRKIKKFSQIDLAKKSGFTQATISRIEKGHQKAEIYTLLLIFTALDADLVITERKNIESDDSHEGLF